MGFESIRNFIVNRRIKHWFEDAFIVALIVINLLDFAELLSLDLDFIDKILAWIGLAYLMYQVNLAKIIFGKEGHEDVRGFKIGLKIGDIDLLIILAYFLLIFKDLVYSATLMVSEDAKIYLETGRHAMIPSIQKIVIFLDSNSLSITTFTFICGGMLLFFISILMAWKYDIRAPSIMHVVHEEGDPSRSLRQFFLRFISIFLILIAFFIVVFNFVLEWLAFAVDAPILILGILIILYTMFKSHKLYDPESLIFKLGNFGETFYEQFLELFYTAKGIFLGLTGILILHLLTDLGNFVLPYLIVIRDSLYFQSLGGSHDNIYTLFMQNYNLASGFFDVVGLFWVYAFSVIGLILLMALPAYLWYKTYISKGFSIPHILLSIFYVAVTVWLISMVLSNMLEIKAIFAVDPDSLLTGVNITTSQYDSDVLSPIYLMIITFLLGAIIYALSYSHYFKSRLILLSIVIVDLFVGYYIGCFAIDLIIKYWSYFSQSAINSSIDFIPLFFMALFGIITALFYVGSFFMFFIESIREYQYIE